MKVFVCMVVIANKHPQTIGLRGSIKKMIMRAVKRWTLMKTRVMTN